MKRYLLSWIFCILTVLVFAVPAAKVTISHTQSDGTVLSLTLVGDEHFHYYLNTATGEAMRQGANGDYYVITEAELSAQTANAATLRAQINQQRIARLPNMQVDAAGAPARVVGQFRTMTGTKKGLVILVDFQDVKFTVDAVNNGDENNPNWDYSGTQAAFNNLFNQQGYNQNNHIGSVKDYFSAQSYGNFTVDFDVVGPVTVSRNMGYYGEDGTYENTNLECHQLHVGEMIIEAVNLADTQYGVDFSEYDWDGNGEVDQIFIIYAGYDQAQGAPIGTIWPHETTLSILHYYGDGSGPVTLDGKTIDTYACSSELSGTSGCTMTGIGTACHEFSHCLGFPDLYDTDGTENGYGYGMIYYDLMAYGCYNGPTAHGEVPCGYSAYERWMVGWLTPTELYADVATITGMVTIDSPTNGGTIISDNTTLANSPSRAYLIKDGNDNNYYLLENRPNTGYFRYFYNSEISASGLFITHVNYDATAWQSNMVNVNASNQRFIFVAADGDLSMSSYLTDFFPSGNATSFLEVRGKQVTNITNTEGLISFEYNGEYYDTGERYTITFNPCGGTVTPMSWTQSYFGQPCPVPEPIPSVVGWEGAGWMTRPLNGNTSPNEILNDIIECDGPLYVPMSDITLYAVYINAEFICNSYPEGSGGDNPITSLEKLAGENEVVKFVENGQLYILKNGRVYNVTGQIIR